MSSFAVNTKAKQMKKTQDVYTKNRAITGVPAVIINGKYKIESAGLDKNNFIEDYNKLVAYLLTLD